MLALTDHLCGGLIKLFAGDSWSHRLQEHPVNPERRLASVRHRGFDAEGDRAKLPCAGHLGEGKCQDSRAYLGEVDGVGDPSGNAQVREGSPVWNVRARYLQLVDGPFVDEICASEMVPTSFITASTRSDSSLRSSAIRFGAQLLGS